MKSIKISLQIGVLFSLFIAIPAFANYVELRANNKTDNYQIKITEGWAIKSEYSLLPHTAMKELMFFNVASNIHLFYKGLNEADYVEFPVCGGGNSYWTTLTIMVENPTEGSGGIPVCSIL